MGALPVLIVHLYFAVAASDPASTQTWQAFLTAPLPVVAGGDTTPPRADIPSPPIPPMALPALPVARKDGAPDSGPGVNWTSLYRSASRFLAVEHGFRLWTEP